MLLNLESKDFGTFRFLASYLTLLGLVNSVPAEIASHWSIKTSEMIA